MSGSVDGGQRRVAGWRPDAALVAAVDALINQQTVAGPRYPEFMQRTIETEEFA